MDQQNQCHLYHCAPAAIHVLLPLIQGSNFLLYNHTDTSPSPNIYSSYQQEKKRKTFISHGYQLRHQVQSSLFKVCRKPGMLLWATLHCPRPSEQQLLSGPPGLDRWVPTCPCARQTQETQNSVEGAHSCSVSQREVIDKV